MTVLVKPSSVLATHPATLMGVPVTTEQQIWLCFLVPTVANFFIYVLDFASCVAVIHCHYKEENYLWAGLTLLILYLPSFVFFTSLVSKTDVWDEQCEQERAPFWFTVRLTNFLLFPVWGIYRYAKQFFWSIEALTHDGDEREKALTQATKTSYTELLLFLHAFLNCVPQALLQLLLLFIEIDDHMETDSTQTMCIASSLMVLASTIVSFHRFESQKVLGRQKPWTRKLPEIEEGQRQSLVRSDSQSTRRGYSFSSYSMKNHPIITLDTTYSETINIRSTNAEDTSDDEAEEEEEEGTPYLKPKATHSSSQRKSDWEIMGLDLQKENPYSDLYQYSRRSSMPHCPPPAPPKPSNISKSENILTLSMPDYSPEMTGAGENRPLKSLRVMSPPDCPPPTPPPLSRASSEDSIRIMSPPDFSPPMPPKEAHDQPSPTNNLPLPNYQAPAPPDPLTNQKSESISKEIVLPRRRILEKGLEQDDLMAKSVLFIGWWLFLVSRMLSIVSFVNFYPGAATGVFLAHYALTVGYLIKTTTYTKVNRVLVPIYLGYVYFFCIIEFKNRFNRPLIAYSAWLAIIIGENITISSVWFAVASWEGWWFNYTYILIFGTLILSILAKGTYFKLLKPKSRTFYVD